MASAATVTMASAVTLLFAMSTMPTVDSYAGNDTNAGKLGECVEPGVTGCMLEEKILKGEIPSLKKCESGCMLAGVLENKKPVNDGCMLEQVRPSFNTNWYILPRPCGEYLNSPEKTEPPLLAPPDYELVHVKAQEWSVPLEDGGSIKCFTIEPTLLKELETGVEIIFRTSALRTIRRVLPNEAGKLGEASVSLTRCVKGETGCMIVQHRVSPQLYEKLEEKKPVDKGCRLQQQMSDRVKTWDILPNPCREYVGGSGHDTEGDGVQQEVWRVPFDDGEQGATRYIDCFTIQQKELETLKEDELKPLTVGNFEGNDTKGMFRRAPKAKRVRMRSANGIKHIVKHVLRKLFAKS